MSEQKVTPAQTPERPTARLDEQKALAHKLAIEFCSRHEAPRALPFPCGSCCADAERFLATLPPSREDFERLRDVAMEEEIATLRASSAALRPAVPEKPQEAVAERIARLLQDRWPIVAHADAFETLCADIAEGLAHPTSPAPRLAEVEAAIDTAARLLIVAWSEKMANLSNVDDIARLQVREAEQYRVAANALRTASGVPAKEAGEAR